MKDTYTIPKYYKDFQCLGSGCRHNCCMGLAVGITMKEYFRLNALDCSPKLRRLLDDALVRIPGGTEELYARIEPDYLGRCHLLSDEGLCLLQQECGYEALTGVCACFPRSPKRDPAVLECSCSNACEATLRLLLHDNDAMSLTTAGLEFSNLSPYPASMCDPFATSKTKIRLRFMEALTDTSLTFHDRIAHLSDMYDHSEYDPTEYEQKTDYEPGFTPERFAFLSCLINWCGKSYESLAPYTVWNLGACQDSGSISCENSYGISAPDNVIRVPIRFTEEAFIPAITAVHERFRGFDDFLGRVFANDVFYRGFPFEDTNIRLGEAVRILCCSADILLVLCAANLGAFSSEYDLIDLFAAFFRMAELTDFQHNISIRMRAYENDNSDDDPDATPTAS